MKNILVTGGAGYLGSVLVPMLLNRGHGVTVVDNFWHGVPSLAGIAHNPMLTIRNGDVREALDRNLVQEFDVIIPLAAVVGERACRESPIYAADINSASVANICHWARSEQLIVFPMTNSGYGRGGEEMCTESSPLNPVSHYGRTKVEAEKRVLARKKNSISLRFATLFGASPRMRLDLLVNDWVRKAVLGESLQLYEGHFRRNFLHVRSAAHAIIWAMEHAHEMQGVYNAGDSSANMTKLQCAELIKLVVPELWFKIEQQEDKQDPDQRDYLVSNEKLEATGWRPLPFTSLADGVRELVKLYEMPFGCDVVYRNAA